MRVKANAEWTALPHRVVQTQAEIGAFRTKPILVAAGKDVVHLSVLRFPGRTTAVRVP